MPTYDYRCEDCDYRFEYFQKMSDEPLKVCPKCGGNVKRLIGGGIGVIFKGSGFYVTDNKKPNSAGSSSSSKKKSDTSDSKMINSDSNKKQKTTA